MRRKKTPLKFFPSIVLFFFSIMLFSIFSCSNQDEIVLRYQVEKNLYNSERLRQVLFINLKAASPDDFKKVMDSYQQVVSLASRAKAPVERDIQDLAASAQLRIAELYLRQKNPDSALSALQLILNNYPQSQSQNKNALLGIAKIYEAKGEKEKAIQTYHQLLENCPPLIKKNLPDPDIFAVPSHLILLYSPREEKEKREQEFEYAKSYYQNLIRAYPSTQVSLAATLGLARAYQLQGEWRKSIEIMETAQDSTGQVPGSVLLQIGNIYYDELKEEKNALATFRRVIDSSLDSLSQAEAQMKIGMIYLQRKDYSRAKSELAKVNRFYPKAVSFVATSQYLIAQIYEKDGEWERALNEYNWLMVNNPLSPEGLESPLRIISHYQRENPALVKESVEKALSHYDELLAQYEDKSFANRIETSKARLYILQKDWDKAINSLEKIAEKYPGTEAGLNALLNLWKLYKQELKDETKSRQILARINSEYPGVITDTSGIG